MIEDTFEEKPKLYNKATIVVFSIFLSTFFGGIIYSQNLSEIGSRKQIGSVLLFSIIWNIFFFKTTQRYTDNVIITFFVPNILGGFMLSNVFWKHHFGDIDFKVKSIWIPLIVTLFIYGAIYSLRFFVR